MGFAFSATSWFNTFLLLLLQRVIPERYDFLVFQGYFPLGKMILELVTAKIS